MLNYPRRFNILMPSLLFMIGAILRLRHFLEQRSLWLDEAYVALNLSCISFEDILRFKPFVGTQASPPMLFQLMEKFFIFLGGNNEMMFRFFPLLSSLLSLGLFWIVCRQCLRGGYRYLGLALFVVSDPLVYYAAELKPYASDVMVSCALWGLYFHVSQKGLTHVRFLLFSLAGIVAVFLSYPSVFVLAGIGLMLLFRFKASSDRAMFRRVFLMGLIWVLGLCALYLFSVRPLFQNTQLMNVIYTFDLFPPVPFLSWHHTQAFGAFMIEHMPAPLGVRPKGVWLALMMFGMVISAFKERERFVVFATPIGLVLITAWAHKYPFWMRFLLFVTPAYIYFLVTGIKGLWQRVPRQNTWIGIIMIGLLFYYPVDQGVRHFYQGREKEDIRSIMQMFKKQYRRGDVVFFNQHAVYGIGYYHGMLGMGRDAIPMTQVVFPREPGEGLSLRTSLYLFNAQGFLDGFIKPEYITQEDQAEWTAHTRTWFIFSHLDPAKEKRVLRYLQKVGEEKYQYRVKGASIYLYDLSGAKNDG